MNKKSLIKIIKKIIKEHFSTSQDEIDNIFLDTDIILDLGSDDLDIIELIMEVEDELEISLDEKPFDKKKEQNKKMTVEDFAKLICEQIGIEPDFKLKEVSRFEFMDIE